MFFSFATNHCFPISHFYKYWKPNWHSWQLGNLTIHCTVRRWGRRGVKKQRGRTANRTETNEHFAWDREIVQVIICRMKEVGLISICCRLLNGTSSFPPPLANWLLIVGYSTIHGFETPETPDTLREHDVTGEKLATVGMLRVLVWPPCPCPPCPCPPCPFTFSPSLCHHISVTILSSQFHYHNLAVTISPYHHLAFSLSPSQSCLHHLADTISLSPYFIDLWPPRQCGRPKYSSIRREGEEML